jgi:hypothetical protein
MLGQKLIICIQKSDERARQLSQRQVTGGGLAPIRLVQDTNPWIRIARGHFSSSVIRTVVDDD